MEHNYFQQGNRIHGIKMRKNARFLGEEWRRNVVILEGRVANLQSWRAGWPIHIFPSVCHKIGPMEKVIRAFLFVQPLYFTSDVYFGRIHICYIIFYYYRPILEYFFHFTHFWNRCFLPGINIPLVLKREPIEMVIKELHYIQFTFFEI